MAGTAVNPIACRHGEGKTLTPTPPPPSEPPDVGLIVSTAARYGIEILGPPGIPPWRSFLL